MTEIIERVGQAIYEVHPEVEWGEATPWSDLGEAQKQTYRTLARAAVAAFKNVLDDELQRTSS